MSDQPDMETNFVIVGAAARHNSNVDMEGYSLLPDIIWTPGPEMLNSQYGKVIFTNVKDSYATNEDLLCMYSIMSGVEVRDDDRVAIFCVGWANVDEVITWVLAAKHPWPNEELSVVFTASQLPSPGTHFYQFCYLSAGEVRGASIPFNFVNKPNVNAEDHQKTLYLRNHGMIGTSAQSNIVSTGEDCIHSVSAGHPQNLTLPPVECRNNVIHPGTSSDEPLRINISEAEASCSEVTSSEQYAPKQKSVKSASLKSMYKDHDTPAVASTSQGVNSAEIAVPPCLCIPSGSKDSNNTENDVAQSTEINNDLQRKVLEIEHEKQMLLSTMNVVSEENARLRAHLNCEIDKNKALTENLRRTEAEVERQMRQYDVTRQNNTVVVTELENELDNQRLRIGELYNVISVKDRTIAYFSQRFGGVNENVIAASGGTPQFPPYPGHTDGQLEQEGHVHIGASSGIQRQDIRASTLPSPFFAALRKTRNYYVTFISDKADIERKVFALTCTKLSLVKKLHTMKERKDSLMRLEYQYYTALQDLCGEQNSESRRILEAISEVTAEQRTLDGKAFMEVDMLDEIKNRLEINRENTCTLRAKAIEVFSKFLESYNYSTEHYNGAAQVEVGHIHALYAGLDTKFNNILCSIANCVNNTYIWE